MHLEILGVDAVGRSLSRRGSLLNQAKERWKLTFPSYQDIWSAMPEGKDEWYVSRSGQRFGPVTFAEMAESARAGRLEPRTDMVIGGHLTEWKPAGDVDGLFEKKQAIDVSQAADPYKPPSDSMADSGSFDFDGSKQQVLKLPGAPRLGYLLGVTILPVVLIVGLIKVMPQIADLVGKEYAPFAAWLVFVLPLIVVVVVTVKRFQNLAMTGWWLFGLCVPVLNWWLYYRLIACPPGYAYTKKLDIPGKILAVIYWLFMVGTIASAFVFAGRLNELAASGKLEELAKEYSEHLPKVPKIPKKP